MLTPEYLQHAAEGAEAITDLFENMAADGAIV